MKIIQIETITQIPDIPALSFVRIHTDEGVVGLGETYYTPESVAAYVHEVIAPVIIGRDPLTDGGIWDDLHERSARRGGGGTDMRALSAVDLALWDLRGQALGVPVHTLLGGSEKPAGVTVYNTCAGTTYSSGSAVGKGTSSDGDDLWMALNAPGELATQLVEQGYTGMKVWPFDAYAAADHGRRIDPDDLRAGVKVIEQIRDAVGDQINVMMEGHGFWHVDPAARILNAVADLDIFWAEDMIVADDPETIGALARRTEVPLAVSEYQMGRWQYRRTLETGAVGWLQLDPSWCGGITESQRILALASSYGVVAGMHDCTGPMNLLAGLHLAHANGIVGYQETLRSFLGEVYPRLVDATFTVTDGRLAAPQRPGLGAALSSRLLDDPRVVRRSTTS